MKNKLKHYYIWRSGKRTEMFLLYDCDTDKCNIKFPNERTFQEEMSNDGYNWFKQGVGKYIDIDDPGVELYRGDVAPSWMFNKMKKSDWNRLQKEI